MNCAVFCLFFLLACATQPYLDINDARVSLEFARTPTEHAQGLMYRESLASNAGMLFVFPDQKPRTFWMKHTLIPLDIIFLDDNLVVVDITTMQPCKADPCETYSSKAPAKYVLEVNAGFAEAHDIGVGTNAVLRE